MQLLGCVSAGGLVSSGASYSQGSVGGLSSQFAVVSMHGMCRTDQQIGAK